MLLRREIEHFWVLTYPDGQFVGIDQSSGGYPWPTDIFRCERFTTKESALKYRTHFQEFKLAEVVCNISILG